MEDENSDQGPRRPYSGNFYFPRCLPPGHRALLARFGGGHILASEKVCPVARRTAVCSGRRPCFRCYYLPRTELPYVQTLGVAEVNMLAAAFFVCFSRINVPEALGLCRSIILSWPHHRCPSPVISDPANQTAITLPFVHQHEPRGRPSGPMCSSPTLKDSEIDQSCKISGIQKYGIL